MKRYGLIGKSLGHSFSRRFFSGFFEAGGIGAEYVNIELASSEEIPEILKQGYSGLNVTIPYKESVIPYLDRLSEEAEVIAAVNVIAFEEGKTVGYNTDAYGFHQSIKPFLTNRHERALILGTGGASKAVVYALKKIGIDTVIVSRTPGEGMFAWEEVNEYMLRACKLIVNCTPLGTYPNVDECPEIPFACLEKEHLVVDLVYNPPKTLFLQKAEEMGAAILNGESMLKLQAMKAWEIWNR